MSRSARTPFSSANQLAIQPGVVMGGAGSDVAAATRGGSEGAESRARRQPRLRRPAARPEGSWTTTDASLPVTRGERRERRLLHAGPANQRGGDAIRHCSWPAFQSRATSRDLPRASVGPRSHDDLQSRQDIADIAAGGPELQHETAFFYERTPDTPDDVTFAGRAGRSLPLSAPPRWPKAHPLQPVSRTGSPARRLRVRAGGA